MNEIDTNGLLSQMRAITAQAQGRLPIGEEQPSTVSFSGLLQGAIENLSSVQSKADDLATRFEAGAKDVDVAEVMIAMQKASLSFQAMSQVRNRLVTAYQDVMNMPI